MFYTRQFYFETEDGEVSMPKAPASFVKLCDIDAFESSIATNWNSSYILNTQGVNFMVDVKTTFDGNTKITASNYNEIMNNNYIRFVIMEMDATNTTTTKTHFQNFSFMDVFGGIRVDDDFKELNLILNHIPRLEGEEVNLSVGYNTNYGSVGIYDYKIAN